MGKCVITIIFVACLQIVSGTGVGAQSSHPNGSTASPGESTQLLLAGERVRLSSEPRPPQQGADAEKVVEGNARPTWDYPDTSPPKKETRAKREQGGVPHWLVWLSICSLALAGVCTLWIVGDILAGHRQHMMIMNFVWPATALYSGPIGLWAYYAWGRRTTHQNVHRAMRNDEGHPGKKRPFSQATAIGATHCGSGCTLGDICAEWLAFWLALSVFGFSILAAWGVDYLFALLFGVAFQYFSIVPMKNLSAGRGLIAAGKADFLSLTAWQVGMYGYMAFAHFFIFEHVLGHKLHVDSPEFWFMMQIAMFFGFATSYPVNWWLLRKGIKEKM